PGRQDHTSILWPPVTPRGISWHRLFARWIRRFSHILLRSLGTRFSPNLGPGPGPLALARTKVRPPDPMVPTHRRVRAMPIITDRHCKTKVSERTKIYDQKCRGLYVSVVPSGVASFYFKFTDQSGK